MSDIRFTSFRSGVLEQQNRKPGWRWDSITNTFANPQFGVVKHVLFWRDGVAQNDQMLRIEKGPGTFIPLNEESGRVGLIQHESRPQLKRAAIENHEANWPEFEIEDIGRSSWEFPRGYASLGERSEQTAVREGAEELQSAVISQRFLGRICGNTALEPHFMTVMVGVIDQTRRGLPQDPNERLLKGATFFNRVEIKELVQRGELYDANTLASITLLDLLMPGAFR